jgi:hypothetical protein
MISEYFYVENLSFFIVAGINCLLLFNSEIKYGYSQDPEILTPDSMVIY